MASTCDVFLSYRHEDTGNTFTSHLNAALTRNGFHTSIPNQTHEAGDNIPDNISTKISDSLVSVVVFSQNYAGSGMCLEELVKIIRCMEENGQRVLPVFLGGVEPAHVRNQIGPFGDAFNVLIRQEALMFKAKECSWRRALKEAANLCGWDSSQKYESIIVNEVVKCIENVLLHKIPLNDLDEGFVGVVRISEVESLLGVGTSERVRVIGLWGMGGVGKTTIAKRVFGRVARHFEGVCFLGNVRERLERNGLDCLQRDIVSQLLGVEGTHILSHSIQSNIKRKRILLVLDDVNGHLDLEKLIGKYGNCGEGSRFMLTSRNKQVLKNNGCKEIYKVEELNQLEAFQLFKLHAFKQNRPTTLHLQLSKRAIGYAQGLPLALKVLGCNLYDKSIKEWESELAKLEQMPDKDIGNILRISFDGLAEKEKSIFLDVACIFKGWAKYRVENILDACGFYAGIGISHLIDRALLTVFGGILWMHDLLQQLGQDIVLHECIEDPSKRSRLWEWKDIYNVLTQNMGSDKIEAITLNLSKVTNMHLMPTVFTKMSKLRVLDFHRGSGIKIHLPDGLEFLPNKLRHLRWDGYPLASLPMTQHLVELNMQGSHVKQLWSGQVEPHLPNLKRLDLTSSIELISLSELSKMPNLENLILCGCSSLVEVPSSIQQLSKLQCINLYGCTSITRLPELPLNVIELNLSSTAIKWLPSSIGSLYQLQILDLTRCKELLSLPSNIGWLQRLQHLSLSLCLNLTSVPKSLGDLVSLETLKMTGTAITSVFLSNLKSLMSHNLGCCWNLSELPENLGNSCFIQGNEKIKRKRGSYRCSILLGFPGRNVPEWFEYSGSGSSLVVKPSTTTRKQLNPRRLAFCVIAVPLSSCYEYFEIECICSFVDEATGVRKRVSRKFNAATGVCFGKSLCRLKLHQCQSKSVFIWYKNDTFRDLNYFSEAVFEFKSHRWTILKSGITPMQQQDVIGGLESVHDQADHEGRVEEGGKPLRKKRKILISE